MGGRGAGNLQGEGTGEVEKEQSPAKTEVGGYLDQVVTEEELAELAGRLPGPFTTLSPLKVLLEKVARTDVPLGMPGAFVDGTGGLRPHAAAVLQTLAAPRSFGSISFAGRGLVFESTTYFPGLDGEDGVSLNNRGDELRVQAPPAAAAAAEMLSLQTGESLLGRIRLEAELSMGEGAVFFGCLDALRRKALTAILAGSVESGYGVSHVEEALGAEEEGMQWLAPFFLTTTALPKPKGRHVRQALTALLEKGLVRKDQGGWKPSPLMRQAAAELLLVDAHARLRQAAIGADGKAAASDLRIVQGRSGAFLLWTADSSTVSISGASAAQVSIMAREVMTPRKSVDRVAVGCAGPAEGREDSHRERYEARLALVQAEAGTVRIDADRIIDTVGIVPRGTRYVKWPYRTATGDGHDFDDLSAISRGSLAELMERTGAQEVGDLSANALKGKGAASAASVIAEAGMTVLGRKQSDEVVIGDGEPGGGDRGPLFEEEDDDTSFTWR